MYQLKKGKESFTMVEGPFKGRKFEPGKSYSEIPPSMSGSFTEIKKATAPAMRAAVVKPAKADDDKKAAVIPLSEKGRK
ncbi:MAG: hypothetical protein NTY86_13235 [Deltaproteobacteria bacterium]|nr:hypothetical protein [Deltaproteobacteria bacterium]